MLEKKEHNYEKVVLVGLITKDQDEEKLTEYMDELEFLLIQQEQQLTEDLPKNVPAGFQNICRKRKSIGD
jgi:hypothetical protein